MREMDAFEQAYKNGYAAGMKAAEEKIVHCKECKHRRDYGMCDHPKAVGWDAIAPEDNDFCSYGERRAV